MTVPAISWGLGIGHRASGLISKHWRNSHFPALSMGMGTTGFPILLTISTPSIVALVISDGKTPGAIAFTSLQ
jgi:hypothetical protein